MRISPIALLPALVLAGCGGGGSGTTAATPVVTGGNAAEISARDALNALRAQADQPPAGLDDVLDTSATRHAGYQAIRRADLTHYESVDGSPGGGADSGNALFTAVGLGDRIRAANHGSDLPGAAAYYEDISSLGGAAAVAHLWNTVYHRVPMLRREVTRLGFGDQAIAAATFPSAHVPAGDGFATLDFAAGSATTVTSFWPADGATGIARSFNTDTEGPDPISSGNGIQNPPTEDDDLVGTPIHVTEPTAAAFSSISATVTPSGGSPVLVYILCGFPGADFGHMPATAGPPGAHNDGDLRAGEIFILPSDPLSPRTTYAVEVHATAGADTFSLAWSFTTGP